MTGCIPIYYLKITMHYYTQDLYSHSQWSVCHGCVYAIGQGIHKSAFLRQTEIESSLRIRQGPNAIYQPHSGCYYRICFTFICCFTFQGWKLVSFSDITTLHRLLFLKFFETFLCQRSPLRLEIYISKEDPAKRAAKI